MILGVPREIKTSENRVALVPAGCELLTAQGHRVLIERSAGEGSGFTDEQYRDAGGKIAGSADEVWAAADMIMKVKEPQESEYPLLRSGLILFTYLHLAPDPEQAEGLMKSGATCIAYETVTAPGGGLPGWPGRGGGPRKGQTSRIETDHLEVELEREAAPAADLARDYLAERPGSTDTHASLAWYLANLGEPMAARQPRLQAA